MQKFYKLAQAKFMVIPKNTPKMKAIMEMLILLATGLAMMREREVLRRYSWIIIENTT